MDEERKVSTWLTPGGNRAQFEWRFRPETTDYNTITSCINDDEYGLKGLELSGWALDVGAHVGGVAISLLVDHPDLKVVAVEPVPDNVTLLLKNAEYNGVADRLFVLAGAADAPSVRSVDIAWNWDGGVDINAHGHRFIGGLSVSQADHTISHDELSCPAYSVGAIMELYGIERFSLLKIDCEGCEARFLRDEHVKYIDLIVGEYHPPQCVAEDVHRMLRRWFEVETWGPVGVTSIGYTTGEIAPDLPGHTVVDPRVGCGFRAVRNRERTPDK